MNANHFVLVKILFICAQAPTERQCSKLLFACTFLKPELGAFVFFNDRAGNL